MIYIDIDGVLSDSDAYIYSLDETAKKNTHMLFKAIYKHSDKVFKDSKPLIDLSVLKEFGKFALLTALPSRSKIDSFCSNQEELNRILKNLENNKKEWVKKNIGDVDLYIVDKRADKIKFCHSQADILIDDSSMTCGMWRKAGGQAFSSIEEYLNKGSKNKVSSAEDKTELW